MSDKKLPDRRDFLRIAAGTFVVASVPVAFRHRSKLVKRTIPAMGATADIVVVHRDEYLANQAINAAFGEIQRIEQLMSRFTAHSDIGRANLMAYAEPVRISAETAFVIRAGIDWAERTNGAFDPAIAPIIDLWDVADRKSPPPASMVKRLANRGYYKHVDLTSNTVRFAEPGMALDLGGIAAGYAVDRAVAKLREHGVRNGFINVSGDIYALGNSEDGDPWKVGVRSPNDPSAIIAMAEVSDAAIATSGDYEQFFLYQGRRYHHIMDPHTAEPRLTDVHTITVKADSCIACDVASTSLFGMNEAQARRISAAHGITIVA